MKLSESGLGMLWWYNLHGHTVRQWDQILEKIPSFVPPNKVDIVRAKLYDCDETFSTSAIPAKYAGALLGFPSEKSQEKSAVWRENLKPHPARKLFPWYSDGLVLKQSVEELYDAGFYYRPGDVPSPGSEPGPGPVSGRLLGSGRHEGALADPSAEN